MVIKEACNSKDFKNYDTQRLREELLISNLFVNNTVNLTYCYIDRIIVGGVVPVKEPLKLGTSNELKSEFFLARREMGVLNIAGKGKIIVDGVTYNMNKYDCLYIGRGSRDIQFISDDENNPAKFYLNSCPAHKDYPTTHAPMSKATPKHVGSKEKSNERTLYKYIYPQGIQSCQLVMGCTMLNEGSVWNTMPVHTHDRRMEVYLYFDLGDDVVFHLMGKGDETRHIVMHNEESVISPSWSIHSGCGTKNYTFIWGMCGENQDFDDMDNIEIKDMK
jgi:4-deoxy-L-threo-5-hexosulose-uronate ketol-isomerase